MNLSRAKLVRFIGAYQSLIIASLILAGSLGVAVAVIIPGVSQISELIALTNKTARQVSVLDSKVELLERLDEATLQKQFATLTSAIPTDQDPASILSTVEGLVGPGLFFSDLSFESQNISSPSGSPQKANEIPFSLSLSGSTSAVEQFLQKAHAVRRLVRVNSVATQVDEHGALIWRLSLSAFYSPIGQTSYTVDQKVPTVTGPEEELILALTKLPLVSGLPLSNGGPPKASGKTDPFIY